MVFEAEKRDLRIIKTERALNDAMYALLAYQAFRKVTVRDICEEALISRATFYSYYLDKYDLLRYWLSSVLPGTINKNDSYENVEKSINNFINNHKAIIKNIMAEADSETIDIVQDCILNLLNLTADNSLNKKGDTKYIVTSRLLAGGIMQYLQWHIKNRFPEEVMNVYLYTIVCGIIDKYHGGKA